MSRRSVLRSGAVAAALAVGACARDPGRAPAGADIVRADAPRAAASDAAASRGAAAVRAFTADLHHRLASATDNLVSSPLSVAIALGMARTGARGRTGAEMDRVLHVRNADDADTGFNALSQHLAGRAGRRRNATGEKADVELRIANSVWAQRGMTWQPSFLDSLARSYGSGLYTADFLREREAAAKAANTWVSRQTDGRIRAVLREQTLTELTRLVLVNAIHLKAPWSDAFLHDDTRPAPFHRATGRVVTTPTMRTVQHLTYRETANWQAVDLPYAGSQLAMTLVLPRASSLARIEQRLDGPELTRMLTSRASQGRQVDLALPTWSARAELSLPETLAAMGMPTAFSELEADLSGMTTDDRLRLDAVEHRAWIAVDEQGTEASAATAVTAVGVSGVAGGPVELRFDRPYLYAVQDLATACPLFIGHVTDPTARAAS